MQNNLPCIKKVVSQLLLHQLDVELVAQRMGFSSREIKHELIKCGLESLDVETLTHLQEGFQLTQESIG
jgi:hypothetical protein